MEFLFDPVMGKPAWMWLAFLIVVVTLLVADLGLFHRTSREISSRESLLMSAFYIAIGIAFGGWVWHQLGLESAEQYLTGFLVEKTLALDNIFVISLIFAFFAVPRHLQHRVLFWGILGVIVLRGIMIAAGAAIVAEYHWVLYVFAAFLIATGVKMLMMGDHQPDIANNPVLRVMQRHMRMTNTLHGENFFVRLPDSATGRAALYATPLFAALVLIEVVDLIFAVDSIPAIFAITTDPYIVYTSNIFAILGLRALYFALAAVIDRFQYLKPALALVLVFIGSKVFVSDLMGWEKFPASVSLAVTVALIGGGVVYSLYETRTKTA